MIREILPDVLLLTSGLVLPRHRRHNPSNLLLILPIALVFFPSSLVTTTHDHLMSLKHDHSPFLAQLAEPDEPDEPNLLPNRSRAATIGASSRASIRSLVDVFNHPQRPKSSTIKPPKTPKMHNSYSILSLASLLHDDYEFVRSPPGSPNKLSPTKSRLLRKSRSRILGSGDHTKDPGPVTPEATAPHLKPSTRNGVRMCPLPVRDVPYPLSYDRVLLQWCVNY